VLTPRTVWKRDHIGESPGVEGDMGGVKCGWSVAAVA
jgi:hypothetical protein